MSLFKDAFISYGRADSKLFAEELTDQLLDRGYSVWFDFQDIPLGVDYQQQINEGIDKAHNFLFIIAPHSINSPYCQLEIELALARKKRIIPLLHVEEISPDIWKRRNPNGTDADWQAYTAQGKHSSYINMHPIIQKINWIYFREDVDDFQQSLQGLMQIFERQKDYVYQHTKLLNQALDWEANQRQFFHLLIGEEREQAKNWLNIEFQDTQPPCIPTDLHCEFITESIKYANGLMTQAFLAYAEEDRSTMIKICNLLQREGFTLWSSQTDIQTGEDFQASIDRGIEETDNLIYLLSPNAVASAYCQHELEYARSLNKRIIPILVQPIDPSQIPEILRTIQYINFTNDLSETDYFFSKSQLIKTLYLDASYHEQRKFLLIRALTWQRYNNIPSLLLRGYNLRQAEAWLKTAKQRSQYRPTALQEEFIQQSLQQPPEANFDVFIAYDAIDADFAHKLDRALQIQGKLTWLDQENLLSEPDMQENINQGIESANCCLLIFSPSFLKSPSCKHQLDYAQQLNKHLIIILYRAIDPTELDPNLATEAHIDFRQDRDFAEPFKELIHVLDTDMDHLQTHTRLLVRAIEWDNKGRNDSLLLRGDDLLSAEQWLKTGSQKSPQPSPQHHNYLAKSREVQDAQERLVAAGKSAQRIVQLGWIFLCATIAGAGFIWFGAKIMQEQMLEETLALMSQQIVEATDQKMDDFAEDSQSVEMLVVQMVDRQLLNLNNLDQICQFLLSLGDSHPDFDWIEIGLENGDLFGVNQVSPNQVNLIKRRWDPEKQTTVKVIESYKTDRKGHFNLLDRQSMLELTYAPDRPWYKNALTNPRHLTWTNIYKFKTTHRLGISSSMTLYQGEKLAGVVSVAFQLVLLSDYLQELQNNRPGVAFILNSKNQVVASSLPYKDLHKDIQANPDLIPPLSQATNPYLQLVNTFIEEKKIDLANLNESLEAPMIDPQTGQKYYVALAKPEHMDWTVGCIIPEAPLKTQFQHYDRISGLVILSFVTAATVGTGVILFKKFRSQRLSA
jgi:hypothetical protein